MVLLLNPLERANLALAKELFAASSEQKRCPYARLDGISAYCVKDINSEEEISEARRHACDPLSLQFWCLDKEACPKCLFYRGKSFN